MSSEQLLPCPFCGESGWPIASDICCENPRCAIYNKMIARSHWNMRVRYAPKVTQAEAVDIIQTTFSKRFKDAPESHRIEAMTAIQALAAAGVQFKEGE